MSPYLLIFFGGGFGSVCRYATGNLAQRWLGIGFPYGTLIVNLLGAFCIGGIAEYLAIKLEVPPQLKFLLITGFLGGYTTFSAFALETASMLQRGDYMTAALYITISIVGTISLVLIAVWLTRLLT